MFWTFQILPSISLLPSSFICKLNVGLTTSTYGGTMWRNIGWIEGSERAPNRIQFVERSVVQRALKRAPDRIQFFKRSEVQRALKELPIAKPSWDDRGFSELWKELPITKMLWDDRGFSKLWKELQITKLRFVELWRVQRALKRASDIMIIFHATEPANNISEIATKQDM